MLDTEGREIMPQDWTEREWSEYTMRRLQRQQFTVRRSEARKRGCFLGIVYGICSLAGLYLLIHVVVALAK